MLPRPPAGEAGGPPGPPTPLPWTWRGLLRGFLFTLLVSLAIATVLFVVDGAGFGKKLVYSVAIGLICWLTVELGRHAVRAVVDRWRARHGLPPGELQGPLRVLGYVLLGALAMVTGPGLGQPLADWLTGTTSRSLFSLDATSTLRVTLLMTLLGTCTAMGVLMLIERNVRLATQAQVARREAVEHRLKLLEAQLEPHMLFNTLANLRILIGTDPPRAQQMLDHLNAFLRATLGGSRAPWHPLRAEFDRLRDYLALMAVRMGPRLSIDLALPDALAAVPVPPLLLQPLVENAIRHGLEPKVGAGRIVVRAWRRADGRLGLSVRDTGVGLSDALPAGAAGTDAGTGGFGLDQVRARLATLYGAAASFDLRAADPAAEGDADGGTVAVIVLPMEDTR